MTTHVSRLVLVLLLLQRRHDLPKLPLDERVLIIPVRMVLDEHSAGLLRAALASEPSRRLGSKDEDCKDNRGTHDLEQARHTPAPLDVGNEKAGDC